MFEKLNEILANVLNLQIDTIDDKLSMKTCERWDSLKHIEVVSSIEDNFDIGRLTMDEMVEMTSYSAICKILASKISR